MAAPLLTIDGLVAGYGPSQVLFGIDLVLALACFALGGRRLSTWRLAASVHKSATTGYAA